MNHQLHPSGFIEKSLRDNPILGRHTAQERVGLVHILDDLIGAGVGQADLARQPSDGVSAIATSRHLFSQIGNRG